MSEVQSGLAGFAFSSHRATTGRSSDRKSPSQSPGQENKPPLSSSLGGRRAGRRIVRGKRGLHSSPSGGVQGNKIRLSPEALALSERLVNEQRGGRIAREGRPSAEGGDGECVLRKRKFSEMSAGSARMAHLLGQAPVLRVPSLTLFYVRVDCERNKRLLQEKERNGFLPHGHGDAFADLMAHRERVEPRKEQKEEDEDGDVGMGSTGRGTGSRDGGERTASAARGGEEDSEPRLVDPSVREEWVEVFPSVKAAATRVWMAQHPSGKVHEYQLQVREGLMLLDLSNVRQQIQDVGAVQRFALDHGCSGFVLNGPRTFLHEPHNLWTLVDDNKQRGRTQYLISDIFKVQSLRQNPVKPPVRQEDTFTGRLAFGFGGSNGFERFG